MKKNVYQFKGNFKSFLFVLALLITFGFLFYTQTLVEVLQEQSSDFLNFRIKIFEENVNSAEDGDMNFFFAEVIQSADYPMVLTDTLYNPIAWRNVGVPETRTGIARGDTLEQLREIIANLRAENDPIPISFQGSVLTYYFYGESFIITQLRLLPYIEILVVAMFILIGYAGFSSIKRGEQRFIWVGMAKETAHQLGTPLSSQIGWLDYLKSSPEALQRVIPELEKDLVRLQTITNRFSQIGSQPDIVPENIEDILNETVTYFRARLPQKNTKTNIHLECESELPLVGLNPDLFSWVLENLIKNGLDALEQNGGSITIKCGNHHDRQVFIDVTDTGKGITGSNRKNIFKPGFSTKKRGWGLGLSLAKRIIEEYHGGKLFLKESYSGKGSCFRIVLKSNAV